MKQLHRIITCSWELSVKLTLWLLTCVEFSVLVRLFLSGAAPLDYGNAPLDSQEYALFWGYFVLEIIVTDCTHSKSATVFRLRMFNLCLAPLAMVSENFNYLRDHTLVLSTLHSTLRHWHYGSRTYMLLCTLSYSSLTHIVLTHTTYTLTHSILTLHSLTTSISMFSLLQALSICVVYVSCVSVRTLHCAQYRHDSTEYYECCNENWSDE